MESVLTKLI